jgi:hypothetical protein
MVSIMSQSFADVEVHIPGGPGGEANFVKLTTGCLKFDEQLETTLHLDGVAEARSLGRLSRASAVRGDNAGRSLDVKMTNHGAVEINLYRFIFRSSKDAIMVAELAEKAMMEEFSTWEASTAARSAEHGNLFGAVKKSLVGRRPLLFEGAQLLGPDPSGDADEVGSEVLLGEGIIALLDPHWHNDPDTKVVAATNTIGSYELLFFGQEEGAHLPIRRFPIGPKTVLQAQDRERAEIDDDEEPALSFILQTFGEEFTITFENVEVAEAFERDFAVRQRLMTVALSTAKKTQEVAKLRTSPWRVSLERAMYGAMAMPAVVSVLAYQSQTIRSGLCYLVCS